MAGFNSDIEFSENFKFTSQIDERVINAVNADKAPSSHRSSNISRNIETGRRNDLNNNTELTRKVTTSSATKLKNPLRNYKSSKKTENNSEAQQSNNVVNKLNSKVRDLANENVTLRNQIKQILKEQNLSAGVDKNGRPTGEDAISVGGNSIAAQIDLEAIKSQSSEALIELIKNLKNENLNLRDSLYSQEATSEHIQ